MRIIEEKLDNRRKTPVTSSSIITQCSSNSTSKSFNSDKESASVLKPVSQLESTLISTSPSSVLQQSDPSLLPITCDDASNVALPKDICDYQNFVLENNVTDIQKIEMIESVFIPEASYKFPKTKKEL